MSSLGHPRPDVNLSLGFLNKENSKPFMSTSLSKRTVRLKLARKIKPVPPKQAPSHRPSDTLINHRQKTRLEGYPTDVFVYLSDEHGCPVFNRCYLYQNHNKSAIHLPWHPEKT